jgi:6-phosphogluconolactonase
MELVNYLSNKIKKYKNINLILSGGNSPLIHYKNLAKSKIDFSNINIFLLDDRIVRSNSKDSNYNNIKKSFQKNKVLSGKICSLTKKNLQKNFVNETIFKLKKYKTFCILGMGLDGHFASIFSESKTFNDEINIKKKPKYFLTKKLGNPRVRRISMNLSMILLSSEILLILSTKKKNKFFKKILNLDNSLKYPITQLAKCAKSYLLIYSEKKILRLKKYIQRNIFKV